MATSNAHTSFIGALIFSLALMLLDNHRDETFSLLSKIILSDFTQGTRNVHFIHSKEIVRFVSL